MVQAITGLDGHSYTRQQLQACVDGGLRIAGYVWCFHGSSVSGRLSMFDGFKLESLWLDVEDMDLTTGAVDRDLALCSGLNYHTTGIYSGKWVFDALGWSHLSLWSHLPLWDSNYDGNGELDTNFRPYGGWTAPTIKQFWGTSSIGNVHQIDLDVQ